MHVLIPLDEECGLLDPLAGVGYATTRPDEELKQAADFMAALVNSGTCRFYKDGANSWVLEVRFPVSAGPERWAH